MSDLRYYFMVKCDDLGIRKLCDNEGEVANLLDHWTKDWHEKFVIQRVTRETVPISHFL